MPGLPMELHYFGVERNEKNGKMGIGFVFPFGSDTQPDSNCLRGCYLLFLFFSLVFPLAAFFLLLCFFSVLSVRLKAISNVFLRASSNNKPKNNSVLHDGGIIMGWFGVAVLLHTAVHACECELVFEQEILVAFSSM